MNPYNEIDGVLADLTELDPNDLGDIKDRLYTILEETIEAARRGEYAD